jgi:hypothetical protein
MPAYNGTGGTKGALAGAQLQVQHLWLDGSGKRSCGTSILNGLQVVTISLPAVRDIMSLPCNPFKYTYWRSVLNGLQVVTISLPAVRDIVSLLRNPFKTNRPWP